MKKDLIYFSIFIEICHKLISISKLPLMKLTANDQTNDEESKKLMTVVLDLIFLKMQLLSNRKQMCHCFNSSKQIIIGINLAI